MLHRRLVSYDAQGVLRGELAESWNREDDGSYVFHLRDGVRFQNGDPVDAEAVRYSMAQIADPKTAAYLRLPLEIVEKVEVVDARTVRFHLKERSATLPFSLASYNCPIVSPKSTEAEAIGCGPYRIADQEKGTRIDFAAFDGFYREGAAADEAAELHQLRGRKPAGRRIADRRRGHDRIRARGSR